MKVVGLYERYEIVFESAVPVRNPIQDVDLRVEFRHLDGDHPSTVSIVRAFWDGGNIWRARFAPSHSGRWSWSSTCSSPENAGLHHKSGDFLCCRTLRLNPFQQHGPLKLSENRRYFIHADGTPFFWMGDTVWNGPLKAGEVEWEEFLADRALKGFNVVQFVAAQWISAAGDAEGRPAYLGREKIQIEPLFFQRLDRRIDRINTFGMLAAPVLAWAAAWNPDSVHLNPGNTLPEDQLILFLRYVISRYGAHQIAWLLAGDGIYEGEEAERWRRIGRAVLLDSTHPATMHPGGKLWVDGEFRDEAWFTFNGYQSGHWNDDENSSWINEGPLASGWTSAPVHPHINLEPCYEQHLAMTSGTPINAHDVRRACYWSLLAAPTAGVTYGAHGIWSWESGPALPLSHPHAGVALSWRDAMHLPGSVSMSYLKALFHSIEWWRLLPCPEMLKVQPGAENPGSFIATACSAERDIGIAYLPEGGTIELQCGIFGEDTTVTCFDPSMGTLLWSITLEQCGPMICCGETDHDGCARDRILLFEDRKNASQ